MAGGRCRTPVGEHADRGVRACAAMDGLSRLGLGHLGRRTGAVLSEEVRVGDRAQRPHSPDAAEGGRPRGVPHGAVHGIPSAGAWFGEESRANGRAGRRAEETPGHCECELRVLERTARHRRYAAGRLKDVNMNKTLEPGGIARRLLLRRAVATVALIGGASRLAEAAGVEVVIDNFTFTP